MIERKLLLLYSLPILVAVIIFENHYARDSVGALEKQIESDIPISPREYSTLNSLYFFPNIFAPLFIGFFCEYFGGATQFLVVSVLVSSLGSLLFALGAQLKIIPLFYFGRFISGCVYEVIDTIPLAFLAPLFRSEWGVIAGLTNCFLRLGSVLTFLLNPIIFELSGVTAALWVSAAIVLSGTVATCVIIRNQNAYQLECSLQEIDTDEAKVTSDSKNSKAEVENPLVAKVEASTPSEDVKSGTVVAESTTFVQFAAKYLPLHLYGRQFHFFNLAGMCLYGSMVPFWFIGSKFIQINYDMTVGQADSLMLLPEGTMVVLSPVLGYMLDKVKWSVRVKLCVLSLACLSLTGAYFMLTSGYHCTTASETRHCRVTVSLIASMFLLGISYAVCNSMLATSIIFVIDEKHLASASGFVASCMNILPSLLPGLIVWLEQRQLKMIVVTSESSGALGGGGGSGGAGSSNVGLYVLSVSAVCAAVFALCSAFSNNATGADALQSARTNSVAIELAETPFRPKINIGEYTAVGTNEECDDPV